MAPHDFAAFNPFRFNFTLLSVWVCCRIKEQGVGEGGGVFVVTAGLRTKLLSHGGKPVGMAPSTRPDLVLFFP